MQADSVRVKKRMLWQRAVLALLCLLSALVLALYQTAFSLKLNQATIFQQGSDLQGREPKTSTVAESLNELNQQTNSIASERGYLQARHPSGPADTNSWSNRHSNNITSDRGNLQAQEPRSSAVDDSFRESSRQPNIIASDSEKVQPLVSKDSAADNSSNDLIQQPHNISSDSGDLQDRESSVSTVSNTLNEANRLTNNNTTESLVTSGKLRSSILRLDEAAPPIRYATSHFLRSIPSSMRLPIEAGLNETVLYSDPWIQKRRYVFEFNPSIVKLPDHQKTLPSAAYLACYRVSTQHACFHQERNGIRHMNYIGFAVLDSQLQVLQETTVDPTIVFKKRYEDFRLFLLNDDLYVASFFALHRFWIVPPVKQISKAVELPALKPCNLSVSVEQSRLCSRDRSVRKTGKSLVYFEDKDGKLLMESYPMQRKEIIPDVSCDNRNASLLLQYVPLNRSLPEPTFNTTDDLYFQQPNLRKPGITGDRGSYCCATIERGGRTYWLGISHLKTRSFKMPTPQNPAPNQYFSRFYAMDMTHPYDVVAQSGKFCLGANVSENVWYYANLTSSRRLQLGNETMNCPGIHFVSGLTDSEDPSQLIIGYGINDCFARFVVVDKAEVAHMLWY